MVDHDMDSGSSDEWEDAQEVQKSPTRTMKDYDSLPDLDLTPRPLKIVKGRKNQHSSTLDSDIDSSTLSPPKLRLSRKSPLPRRSTSLTGQTQLDLSIRNPSEPVSPWSRRHAFLNVPRVQCPAPHSRAASAAERTSECLRLIGGVPTNASVALDENASTCGLQGDRRPRKGHKDDAQNATRSFSEAVPPMRVDSSLLQRGGRPEHQHTRINKQRPPVAGVNPDTGLQRHHEAVLLDKTNHVHVPRRQPSLKHRLLNRMMSGLSNHPHPKVEASCEASQIEANPPGFEMDTSASHRSSVGSSTIPDSASDLEFALSVFPTPPSSTVTSPVASRSRASSGVFPRDCYTFSTPYYSPTIGVDLRLISEDDHYIPGQDAFLAVEINAVPLYGNGKEHTWYESNALDVAVVIDNSSYNSPDSLLSSCETARHIASLLDPESDRFAVYTTCSDVRDESKNATSIVMSFGKVKKRKIKAALDQISTSTVLREKLAIVKARKLVHEDLMQLKSTSLASTSSASNRYGHVFMISADAEALRDAKLFEEPIQTHIIHPGCPRQEQWEAISCNGWKMSSRPNENVGATAPRRQTGSPAFAHKLQDLMHYARLGRRPEMLTNIHLELISERSCAIECVMGNPTIAQLHAGESRTIPVRISTTKMAESSQSFASPISNFNASTDGDSLLHELDRLLTLADMVMITAKLNYKHPLLPAGTICSLNRSCQLQKLAGRGEHEYTTKGLSSSHILDCKRKVQEAVALSIVGQNLPQVALNSMLREFGEGGTRSCSAIFINCLSKELKYRLRMEERLAIQNSPLKSRASPNPNDPRERPRLSPRDPIYYKPRDWINVSDSEAQPIENSPTEVTEQLGLDQASRIWTDIRNRSNSSVERQQGSKRSPLKEYEKLEAKRELVPKNKGNTSLSTIRSFTMPIRTPKYGRQAAWP